MDSDEPFEKSIKFNISADICICKCADEDFAIMISAILFHDFKIDLLKVVSTKF